MSATVWKRLLYLTHRWVGIVLGLLVLAWFVSGIALMYYPWPAPTESEELAMHPPLDMRAPLVGFAAAWREGRAFLGEGSGAVAIAARDLAGARLLQWDGRPMYELWRQRGGHHEVALLVDAVRGTVHLPVTRDEARRVAESALGLGVAAGVDSLRVGDHYMMASEYAREFPAWRVDFGDRARTSAYVSRRTGRIVGIVDRRTRLTTWLGTVPHWLYFQWLHDRPSAWTWANYLLPAIATLIALTGIVLGAQQLFPRRRRGEWRMSAYRGVSRWHHVSGVVFGALVLTWTVTGVLEMLGPGITPPRTVMDRAQGAGAVVAVRLSEADAVAAARRLEARPTPLHAIDLVWSGGTAGYVVHLAGTSVFVDAATGAARTTIGDTEAIAIARRVAGADARVRDVLLLNTYDSYYYAGHDRALVLPVVRVRLEDAEATALYLDAGSGLPRGLANASTRRWRWWRDALHTFDLPALNNRRPLWDIVTLIPMLGGTVVALTGVWLVGRRSRRVARALSRRRLPDRTAA